MEAEDFKEVGHSGGQVQFTVSLGTDGSKSYQIGYIHNRPTALTIFGIFALSDGTPVGDYNIGFENPEQAPGWLPIFIASDSEGLFGHACPRCTNYWRAGAGVSICPYCRLKAPRYVFLSDAQRAYVNYYCELLRDTIDKGDSAIIDLDAVADAVGTTDKPPFYYAEKKQQHKFKCEACGFINDVLGKYAFCSSCGTKNNLQVLKEHFDQLRLEINQSRSYERFVKDVISALDVFSDSYGKELTSVIPLTTNRLHLMKTLNYHSLEKVSERFQNFFDINLKLGITDDEYKFLQLMMLRRHVYEHLGGQVDEDYIAKSGDTSVSLRQSLRETQESIHRLLNIVYKMAENIHNGFHDIIKPLKAPMDFHNQKMSRKSDK